MSSVEKYVDEINPLFLVGFSNGSIKPSKIGCLTYTSYRSSEMFKKRPKKILVVNNGRLTYTGNNYDNEMTSVTSSVWKIGFYSKSKNKMIMYDVDFFFLKPLLKCTLKIDNTEKSFIQKADDLALSFGSKNIQTFVKSRNKQGQLNLSSLENISVKSLDEGLKAMTADTQQGTVPSIFPQPNESATDVSQIYNLHDILPKETYDALDAESNMFLNAARHQIDLWKQENKYCEFVLKFLEFNLTSMNAHKAKLLLYYHYMTCFLRLTYLDWRKKDPLPEVPKLFKEELMKQFVINKKMSQTLKDKLVSHALILVLILNNYFVDAKIFCSSTKFPMIRLTSIAYALGCHVSDKKNENTKIILLKLPLYKPIIKNFKRRK